MRLLSRHLYLRIWLAVVLGVAVLMALVGWAWRASVAHNAATWPQREWVIRNAQGEVLASTSVRSLQGQALPLDLPLGNGQQARLYLERRDENAGLPMGGAMRPHRLRDLPPWWARPPYGFFWMLSLMGLATALALYPVVRHLTKRLEGLRQGVQRWGDGDLSVRVPESGEDEVADLSRRFNAAAERIQRLMGAQKSLLANASHELRSPLARIRMGLELMETVDEAARRRTRSEILRNMTELDQLIDEILLASRLDAREADMGTVERVDLVGLCAEECARVGARLDVSEGLGDLEVQGVAKLLRRMVRNLLENAMRHGAVAGAANEVVLSMSRQDGVPVLRVCDRGPGVPPPYRERIFEPFFRLPGASERAGGVGLGLALVKSIAERHGAQVRCTDHAGGGVCFELRGFSALAA